MKQKVFGVVPPISTPIDDREHVDEKALRKLIDHCIDKGLHGIFVCGTNGECMGLTQRERNKAIKITLDHVAGRVPVLAGCMDSSTARVIDNVKAFEQMGGLTAVVTPEFYSRHSTPEETIRHIEQVARNTEADLFVYNIPPFTGNTISAKAVFEMAAFDHVVGYKDTSGNFGDFIRCLNHFRGTDFMLFQGMTQLAGPSLLLGADGFIPNIGPVEPELCLKVYEYAKKGDIEKTMAYVDLLIQAQDCFNYAKYGIAACKAACSEMGFMSQRMCQPSEPVTEEQKTKIMESLYIVEEKRRRMPF